MKIQIKKLFPVVAFALLACGVWYDFNNFLNNTEYYKNTSLHNPPARADAIVVLTGGKTRITDGLVLLEKGLAKQLLISGVGKEFTKNNINGKRLSKDLLTCCVTLGYDATSTFGNAVEAKAWMDKNHYRSMFLVTAYYHLPRSMSIFQASMPDIKITPYAVIPNARQGNHGRKFISILTTEYIKSISSRLRLWSLKP